MTIDFLCPRGHRFQACPTTTAAIMNCPTCGEPVTIPPAPQVNAATISVKAPPVQGAASGIGNETATLKGYYPDRGKIVTVRWMGVSLLIVTLAGAFPAFIPHLRSDWPVWVRIVLLLSALQTVYIFWMVSMPDWSTVWVLTLGYPGLATVYGFTMGVALLTPIEQPVLLELDNVRDRAAMWSGAMLMLTFLCSFSCGRYSQKWHKACVLAAAGRNG